MTKGGLRLETRKLTPAEKREIRRRERKHRDRLARQGYTTQAVVDDSGTFAVVLVEDPASGRKGMLLPDGKVRWVDQAMGPGALADAAVSGVSIDGTPPEKP